MIITQTDVGLQLAASPPLALLSKHKMCSLHQHKTLWPTSDLTKRFYTVFIEYTNLACADHYNIFTEWRHKPSKWTERGLCTMCTPSIYPYFTAVWCISLHSWSMKHPTRHKAGVGSVPEGQGGGDMFRFILDRDGHLSSTGQGQLWIHILV